MDDLPAGRIWQVEAEALRAPERSVLRMTLDGGAVYDLYLFGRGANRILLLLKLSDILLSRGASGERHDRQSEKNRPHRYRLLRIGVTNWRAGRKMFSSTRSSSRC